MWTVKPVRELTGAFFDVVADGDADARACRCEDADYANLIADMLNSDDPGFQARVEAIAIKRGDQ